MITNLESHKLVIWFRRPRINLYRVFQCNHEEFDSFVFDDFEVDRALQVTDIDPSVSSLNLLKVATKILI